MLTAMVLIDVDAGRIPEVGVQLRERPIPADLEHVDYEADPHSRVRVQTYGIPPARPSSAVRHPSRRVRRSPARHRPTPCFYKRRQCPRHKLCDLRAMSI